jgi:hypothetical protein
MADAKGKSDDLAARLTAKYGAALRAAREARESPPEEQAKAAEYTASLPELPTDGSTAIFIPSRRGGDAKPQED